MFNQLLKLGGGVATAAGLMLALSSPAAAHNRAHLILPNGECIVV